MCILVFSVNPNSKYKFIIAFNRDQYTDRPTLPAHCWKDSPQILAGRDQVGKGTWFGVNRKTGRFCCLTNFREPNPTPAKVSRGKIVTSYLQIQNSDESFFKCEQDWEAYIQNPDLETNPFNILYGNLSDKQFSVKYYSPRSSLGRVQITSGLGSFSNGTLNSKWEKTERLQLNFHRFMQKRSDQSPQNICHALADQIMSDPSRSPLLKVQKTGCPYWKELALSPIFLEKKKNYGTRTTSVLLMDHENQVTFLERTHLHAPERNFVSRVLFPKLRTESNEDRGYRFKVGEEEKIEEFE